MDTSRGRNVSCPLQEDGIPVQDLRRARGRGAFIKFIVSEQTAETGDVFRGPAMNPGHDSGARGRNNVAIWILLLVICVGAGAAGWWYLRRGGPAPPSSGFAALAAAVPADTQVFVALDLRDRTSTASLVGKVDAFRQANPGFGKQIDEVEKKLGVRLADLAKWMEPAGLMALVPKEGQKSIIPSSLDGSHPLEAIFALAVSDEAAAGTALEALSSKAPSHPKSVDKDGVRFWVADNGATVAVAHRYLWLGSGVAPLQRAFAAVSGSAPALGGQKQFVEAAQHLIQRSGLFTYVAVRDALGSLDQLSAVKPYLDDKTMQAIKSVEYFASISDLMSKDGDAQAFLKIDPTAQSEFAHTVLHPSALDPGVAAFFPRRWGNFVSLNVSYAAGVIYQMVLLAPQARLKVSAIPTMASFALGFDPFGEFQKVSNGDLAYSSDALQNLPAIFTGQFAASRGRGQLIACESNLKNIGTAAEMYAVDHKGRYPASLADLKGEYLRQIPTCPAAGRDTYSATWRSSTGPDRYEVACGGHNHAGAGAAENAPAYNSEVGLSGVPPSASSGPTPPVTLVAALSLKDPSAAQAFIQKLEQKARLSSHEVKTVGGVEIRGYDNLPMRWTIVSKPVAALLLAEGPKADERLEEALRSSEKPAEAVTSNPDYQAMAKETQGKIVETDYNDLTPLVGGVSTLLEQAAAQTPEYGDLIHWVQERLKTAGPIQVTSLITVEPDGVRLRSRGLDVMSIGAAAGFGAAIAVPNFIRARSQGEATACKSNLKNIGTALEMYSTDNAGRFPEHLSALSPNYLRAMPTCPAASSDTYSDGYAVSGSNYTVICGGAHHTAVGYSANYPQYSSTQGLRER
jgi:hypothetical protein